jgi:3-mercaptopyruvate sulfurtransferase SseA
VVVDARTRIRYLVVRAPGSGGHIEGRQCSGTTANLTGRPFQDLDSLRGLYTVTVLGGARGRSVATYCGSVTTSTSSR